jgi:hypothetical protein
MCANLVCLRFAALAPLAVAVAAAVLLLLLLQ